MGASRRGGGAAKRVGEELPRVASGGGGDLLGGALGDDAAVGVAALRAQVDDPVGALDHVQVVLTPHAPASARDKSLG